jgi:hypothetical protein
MVFLSLSFFPLILEVFILFFRKLEVALWEVILVEPLELVP